ncbi:hypothetical protein Tco_0392991 [Tanacetum coccineum]
MEATVQQYHVDKQCFEIQKKQLLIENDQLLDQIISQDIVNIVVNSSLDINNSVNMNSSVAMNDFVNYVEICNKCLELEAELIKQHNMVEKDEYNKLSKRFSELEEHCISLEIAMQLNKEFFQKNNYETYKQLYDSIKPSRVQAKEHVESLGNQLNQKSVEITDLNAQLQEKGFCHNSIKNNLRKFKGKDIVDNAAQTSNATSIAPGMEIVEQSKSLNPLDSVSYSAYKYVKLIQELLGYVRETCPDIHKPSEK